MLTMHMVDEERAYMYPNCVVAVKFCKRVKMPKAKCENEK